MPTTLTTATAQTSAASAAGDSAPQAIAPLAAPGADGGGNAGPADADSRAIVAKAVSKVTAIATLPEVTVQIIKTVEDPRSSAAQLHKIISHDPALVTRILKVVNSSFYGLPGQIGSVERAIVLLGLNAVKNIAVAASLGQLFRGVKLCEGYTAKELWQHCVGVAVTARHLAREMKIPIADEAFLAGMIHDIGLLVSLQIWPEKLRQACERAMSLVSSGAAGAVEGGADGTSFCQIERQIMQVDHQQLGAGLAEMWKFPRSCQLVAGHHHEPAILADNNRLLVTLVFVADTLCCQAAHGFNLTALRQRLDEGRLSEVKIESELIDRTQRNLPQILDSAKGLF
ncbi:HDOD domain-containing protein [Fontivita pretiosa]|uniref:HDOD domain-containing protein n=1 Tax=Fontivita pretiosa TaxID=2989684 RepID=UPI003D16894B